MYYCLMEDNTIRMLKHRPYHNKTKNYYYDTDFEYDYGVVKAIELKIKIFSEDVFDLIEIGDLVELDMNENLPTIIHKYEHYDLEAMRDLKIVDNYCIAIYKPDASGNYIKVWSDEQ